MNTKLYMLWPVLSCSCWDRVVILTRLAKDRNKNREWNVSKPGKQERQAERLGRNKQWPNYRQWRWSFILGNSKWNFFLSRLPCGHPHRLIYDLIHYLIYNNLLWLFICIDFKKAFDSVDWKLTMKILKAFGSGPIIYQWIYTFCNRIKSAVNVNGHTSPWFSIDRWYCQGNPIWP